MKKHSFLKKLLALTLTTTMTLASGIVAFADDGTETPDYKYYVNGEGLILGEGYYESFEVVKTLEIEDNVYLPDGTTFTFSVTPCSDVDSDNETVDEGNVCKNDWEYGEENYVVYKGITDGVYFASGTDEDGDKYDNAVITYVAGTETYSTKLSINTDKFEKAGVYHYVVEETSGNLTGMTYSTTSYDLYVFILRDDNDDLYCSVIIPVENEKTVKSDEIEFINTYDTENLTLKKIVSGSQASTSNYFEFTVEISGCYLGQVLYDGTNKIVVEYDEDEVGEDGYYPVKDDNGVVLYYVSYDSGSDDYEVIISVSLKHDEDYTIYGLTSSNSYKITESENEDGYTVSYLIDDEEYSESVTNTFSSGSSASKSTDDAKYDTSDDEVGDDDYVTFRNEKDPPSATGVVLDYLPYVLLLAFAGAVGFVFFRRRRADY